MTEEAGTAADGWNVLVKWLLKHRRNRINATYYDLGTINIISFSVPDEKSSQGAV